MNKNVQDLSTALINLLNRLGTKFLVINEEYQVRLEIYYPGHNYSTIHYTILITVYDVSYAQVWCDKGRTPKRLHEINMIEVMELLVSEGRY